MDEASWVQLIRLLQSLGLAVVHVDRERLELLVRVPPSR
jgi:hypothetical protein